MTGRLAEFVEAHGRALVLVVLSFALAGLILMFRIPIAIFPQTDFPRIVILVDNGIAPVDVQMLTVTRPIEEAIRLVPDITDVRSVTSRGGTVINVFFRWDTDIQNALNLVQGRISQILPTLPRGEQVLHQPADLRSVPDDRLQHDVAEAQPRRVVRPRLLSARAEAVPAARRRADEDRRRTAAGDARGGAIPRS